MVGDSSRSHDPRWDRFLSEERLRASKVKGRSDYDARSQFENDYDRVIFSSSFRRLKNKAQVFSLESHDFVRTRLTHSIEVSTIGRALGEGVAKHLALEGRDVGDLVATACLLHDIGNPPFGHSGEDAIGDWFKHNAKERFSFKDQQELADLIGFEGNAQAFRIASRLQWSGDEYGMNLTAATLSTLVKYPCSSTQSKGDQGPKALTKFGYFKDDKATFDDVRQRTGLEGYMRHPLTFLMEVADDIAYAAADLEDVLKKGLVDYESIHGILDEQGDESAAEMIRMYLDDPFNKLAKVTDKRERQQLALQRFSQMAVRMMTQSAIECFVGSAEDMVNGKFDSALVEKMKLARLCAALKAVMEQAVYQHLEIAHREQAARNVIHGLFEAILRELRENADGTLAKKVYRPAPRNHRDCNDTSADYQLALRMTDHVSGMTDAFAVAEYQRINAMGATLKWG